MTDQFRIDNAYSTVEDLQLGNLPIPASLKAQRYVGDASDEIDSRLGFYYKVPLEFDPLDYKHHASRLLVKRINILLSTSKIVAAINVGVEDKQLNAYAKQLSDQANGFIDQIINGYYTLVGPTPVSPNTGGITRVAGLSISNVDAKSFVEEEYDKLRCPPHPWYPPNRFPFGPYSPYWGPV